MGKMSPLKSLIHRIPAVLIHMIVSSNKSDLCGLSYRLDHRVNCTVTGASFGECINNKPRMRLCPVRRAVDDPVHADTATSALIRAKCTWERELGGRGREKELVEVYEGEPSDGSSMLVDALFIRRSLGKTCGLSQAMTPWFSRFRTGEVRVCVWDGTCACNDVFMAKQRGG